MPEPGRCAPRARKTASGIACSRATANDAVAVATSSTNASVADCRPLEVSTNMHWRMGDCISQ